MSVAVFIGVAATSNIKLGTNIENNFMIGKFNNYPSRHIIPLTIVAGNSGMVRNKKICG